MTDEEIMTFEEVRKRIEKHMATALKVEDFDITYAKVVNDEWHVNLEWKKENGFFSSTVAVSLDAKTGELKSFAKNKYWTW